MHCGVVLVLLVALPAALGAGAPDPLAYAPARVADASVVALWEFNEKSGSVAFDSSGRAPALPLTLAAGASWVGSRAGVAVDASGGGPDGLAASGSAAGIQKIFDSTAFPGGFNYTTEVWSMPTAFPAPGSGLGHTLFQLCDSPSNYAVDSIRPPCIRQSIDAAAPPSPSALTHSFSWQLVYEPIPPSSYLTKSALGFSQALPFTSSLRHSVARYRTTAPAPFGTLGPGSATGEMWIDGAEFSDTVTGSRQTQGLPINMWTTLAPQTPDTWNAHPVSNRTFSVGFNYDENGNVQASSGFKGEIYLIALYDRALSDAEIAANYASGPPTTAPTTGPTTPVASAENANVTLHFPGTDVDAVLGWDTALSVRVTSLTLASPIASFFTAPNYGTLYNADGSAVVLGADATTLAPTGPSLTFVPATGLYGTLTFSFASVDARRAVSPVVETLTLNVANVEHAPKALVSTNTTVAGSPVRITLAGSDLDPESLLRPTITLVPDANLYGTLRKVDGSPVVVNQIILSSTRLTQVVFTPRTNLGLLFRVASITAPFKFSLTDSLTGVVSNQADAFVVIENNAVAAGGSAVLAEETRTTLTLTGSDRAAPGASLTFKITQLPSGGDLYDVATGARIAAEDAVVGVGTSVTVAYEPRADFFGSDLFRYTVVSGVSLAESVPAVFSLNVTNVNDAPRLLDYQVEFFALDGNTTFELLVIEVDSDDVTFEVSSLPTPAGLVSLAQATSLTAITTPSVVVTDVLDRLVAFALAPTVESTQGYYADFRYDAEDATTLGAASEGTVRVFVKHSFFAGNLTVSIPEDSSAALALPTADYFGRPYSAFLVSLPASGGLRTAPSAPLLTAADLPIELLVDPVTGGAGIEYVAGRDAVVERDAFEFEIRDTAGRGEVVRGYAFVTTTPVPDPPVVELTSTDPLVIVDGEILAVTELRVAEVDDAAAIVDVNVTVVSAGLVGGAGTSTLTKTTTFSGTTAEVAAFLAPLSFRSAPTQRVTESTPFEVAVTASSEGETSTFAFFINVLPRAEDDDRSLDGTLVAAVAAAAGTALLFGAIGAWILWTRQESEAKLPPPPDFEPYIYARHRLEGPNGEHTAAPAPESMLSDFVQLLVQPGYGLVFALFEVSAESDIDAVCERLAFVFEGSGGALNLVASVAQREIEMAPAASTLFRSNSRACKLHSVYAKMVGLPYLYATLGPVFLELASAEGSLEVDASKVRKSARDSTDVRINKWQLLVVAQKVLTAILGSAAKVPYEFRQLAHTLSHDVSKPTAFPERRTAALGTFFFLRFICPAIAQPEDYALVREVPSSDLRRLLVLVAKTLQNLANGTEFKEDYLEPMNVFIRANWDEVAVFLDELATLPPGVGRGGGASVPNDVHRMSVAYLYNHVRSVEDDVHTLLRGVPGTGRAVAELDEAVYRVLRVSPVANA